MTDGIGLTRFQYHPSGQLGANQIMLEDGPYQNDSVQYGYDALGRVVTRTVDTVAENYAFDAIGRLAADQNPLGAYSYHYLGQTNQIARISGGAVETRYAYEPNLHDRRLRKILNLAKGGAQGAFYRTNPENLITRIDAFGRPLRHAEEADRDDGHDRDDRDDRDEHEDGRIQRHAYRYDGVDRVTDDIAKTGAHYAYDLADNLLSAKGRKIDFAASYNDVNQIVAANSANYQYDANGNLLDDGQRQYAWDAENRLLSIADKAVPGKLTRFRYDGLSRRLAIIDQADTAAIPVEKRYLWCDLTLCQERDAQDQVTKHYYPQGETQGSATLYYARDHLDSVKAVFNARGNIEATNEYDAYGNTTSSSKSGVNADFRYAGMFYHEPSKLYLTLYRAYDPNTARWLSRDPIEEDGGINLYAYVGGNPVNFFDMLGLISETEVANIIFNETRSFSGPNVNEARVNIAHAIYNGEEARGANRPRAAPSTVRNIPRNEVPTYQACLNAATQALNNQIMGIDPTNGATNFNFRNSNSRVPFFGIPISTQVGPLNNSYTRGGLNSQGVYANTYGGQP